MDKKISGYIKLEVPAGKAVPAPPIGPALGQRGINIKEFCDNFNSKTKDLEPNMPIPTLVTVYEDKSFTFTTKSSPASHYLKKAAKLNKGSGLPGRESAGSVTMEQCREIARLKIADLNTSDVESAAKMIAGSARSMGLDVR